MSEIDSDNDEINKIPLKRGKKWSEEEDAQMLNLLKDKKTYEDISNVIDRTPNAVKCHIEKLVYDSYTNNTETLDEISKWSGLTKAEIDYVIVINNNKANKVKQKEKTHNDLSELKHITSLLNDIQTKVNKIMDKYEHTQTNNVIEKPKINSPCQIVVVKPPIDQNAKITIKSKPLDNDQKKIIVKGKY